MEWLAVPILAVMHASTRTSGNYGVAIILLTVITKVLFFPLTRQEHDVDEGDAGAPAADQCAALEVQERSADACSRRRWSSTGPTR